MQLKFPVIPPISFCSSAVTNFVSHEDRQTDRHFVEMLKSCSGHLKMCKTVKNRNLKSFTIPVLSLYTENRKTLLLRDRKSNYQCLY